MRLPSGPTLARLFRAAFLARRAQSRAHRAVESALGIESAQSQAERVSRDDLRAGREQGRARRNILFVTVDQQRYDALGINGGRVARTPAIDALARSGVNYERAHVQNVVCMPSRSTMLTGQYPLTHGVVANGVALPEDAPSVAQYLRRHAGYRTALIGKAHFEPHLDPALRFAENRFALEESTGPWRGFEHIELASHGPVVGHHYADWLWREHPDEVDGFGGVLTGEGGGDTGAPEVKHNPVARAHYHTDWIADRAVAWLESLRGDEPWFLWVSFPDPHHPFDPPLDEVRARVDWRELSLPPGHPGSREAIEAVLRQKPRHWLDWYQGRFNNPEGGPTHFAPAALTHDQLREVHAMIHVENELIDEACARLVGTLRVTGCDARTDVFYTSDHGELQGDFGLLYKGPYHVDALMRVPLVWRPAPEAGTVPAAIPEPVGLIDLAPTWCAIAGLEVPAWMEGRPLPTAPGSSRERVLTTFDSQFAPVGMHLRTIYRDGWVCTVYEPSTTDAGGKWPLYWAVWGRGSTVPRFDGTEGELYDCRNDPLQWRNRWGDPDVRRWRDELIADLRAHLPPARRPALPFSAPT